MEIKTYISYLYSFLKMVFDSSHHLDNNMLVGTIREYIADNILSFFPEPRDRGWICDHTGKLTGQIDLLLLSDKALRIPGILLGDSPVNGFFSTQVCCAFEIKSSIASSMPELLSKTWECHRLVGGHLQEKVWETFQGQDFRFKFDEGVPICVIGNKGFAKPESYLEHFEKFSELAYSVNKKMIEKPTGISQIVPELLLDFTNDVLLVKNNLHPDLIKLCFKISEDNIYTNEWFTCFTNLDDGQALMALFYYLDALRLNLLLSQIGAGTPLLDLFAS